MNVGPATVDLGIFARIFTRPAAPDVAAAVAGAGFGITQLNLSAVGLPTLPPADLDVGFGAIGAAFAAQRVTIWGLSATYNVIHPDPSVRHQGTARAKALISRAAELGAGVVTLCTGSRDGDDMWRAHPDNLAEEAWRDMRASLDQLLAAAERAGVASASSPSRGTSSPAPTGRVRLLAELGPDSGLVGIVLDPANLVSPSTLADQDRVLRAAFADLGEHTVALHAKDVVPDGAYAAAGRGGLDYDLVFALHARLPRPVPVIIQDATEADVPRTRAFLLERAGLAAGPAEAG